MAAARGTHRTLGYPDRDGAPVLLRTSTRRDELATTILCHVRVPDARAGDGEKHRLAGAAFGISLI